MIKRTTSAFHGLCAGLLLFSMAYSPSPTCGPSRTSIQYGLTPSSVGKFAEELPRNLPPVADAMVMRLKAAFPQYKAAHFGKWHQRTRAPEEIGYDESDGKTMNLQTTDPEDPKHTFSLARKAKDFITRQAKAKTPFFLQVSFYANHLKYHALPEAIEKYKARADKATQYQKDPVWAAMNEDLDRGEEHLFSLWEDLGESKNLLTEMPDRADQLRRNLDEYFRRVGWDQNEHEGYRAKRMAKRAAMKGKSRKKKQR